MNKGFTLIEILVVITIISLLAGAAFLSYSQINKAARDARRKSDLEQIRMALEMYRSANDVYPDSLTTCQSGDSLTDSNNNTYLSDIPNDPRCSDYKYYYTPIADGDGNNTDYTLGARLETGGTDCAGTDSCGTDKPCNYCLGPFGKK